MPRTPLNQPKLATKHKSHSDCSQCKLRHQKCLVTSKGDCMRCCKFGRRCSLVVNANLTALRSRPITQDILQRFLERIGHLDLTGKIWEISPVMKAHGGYSDIFTGYCSVSRSRGKKKMKVAVKRLRVHIMGDKKFQKKLVKELYIWTKLHHPYILPLHGFFFEDNNYPSMVSAWTENGTVLAYLESHPDCDLLQIVLHIAEGIDYLHSNGIIHSDIKPENILISSSGEPRICDFGISRMLAVSGSINFSTTTGSTGGTVRYMSIELLAPTDEHCDIYSKASDVWAFGMTILVLLTGKQPYSHIKLEYGVVSAIASGLLPPIPEEYTNKTWPEVNRNLWELCMRCWAGLPSERPSMFDIVTDLRTYRIYGSRVVGRPCELSIGDVYGTRPSKYTNGKISLNNWRLDPRHPPSGLRHSRRPLGHTRIHQMEIETRPKPPQVVHPPSHLRFESSDRAERRSHKSLDHVERWRRPAERSHDPRSSAPSKLESSQYASIL